MVFLWFSKPTHGYCKMRIKEVWIVPLCRKLSCRLRNTVDSRLDSWPFYARSERRPTPAEFLHFSGCWFGTWLLFFHSVGNVIIPTGYGSIPINTIFRGLFTSIYQLFWCELQGYYWFWPTANWLSLHDFSDSTGSKPPSSESMGEAKRSQGIQLGSDSARNFLWWSQNQVGLGQVCHFYGGADGEKSPSIWVKPF